MVTRGESPQPVRLVLRDWLAVVGVLVGVMGSLAGVWWSVYQETARNREMVLSAGGDLQAVSAILDRVSRQLDTITITLADHERRLSRREDNQFTHQDGAKLAASVSEHAATLAHHADQLRRHEERLDRITRDTPAAE